MIVGPPEWHDSGMIVGPPEWHDSGMIVGWDDHGMIVGFTSGIFLVDDFSIRHHQCVGLRYPRDAAVITLDVPADCIITTHRATVNK
jgi:hypothetical protein